MQSLLCRAGYLAAGFVRVAAEQGAALVPVLCLGEVSALRNLIDLPAVQVCLLLTALLLWLEHGHAMRAFQAALICPAAHLRAIRQSMPHRNYHPALLALQALLQASSAVSS